MVSANEKMQDANSTSEDGPSNPPAYATAGTSQGISEGLYVLTNRNTRKILDLFGGGLASRTPCIGWERNADHTFDHQLWALKSVGERNAYTLMSLRSGLFVDLEAGKKENKSGVICHPRVHRETSRLHREWRLLEGVSGDYRIQCTRTDTFLEMGESDNEKKKLVYCSAAAEEELEGQLWDLERASRTTLEIKALVGAWKPDLLTQLFQPHGDNTEYLVLPSKLRDTIWSQTKLVDQPIYKNTFDYDSFVIKARDAVNTWARDRFKVHQMQGYSVLFGIVFGEVKKGPKAHNWYLSPDMRSLVFFDAQTGKEYTPAALDGFGFEPRLPCYDR